MARCPKELKVELPAGSLPGCLPAQCCPDCGGAWISSEHYANGQTDQGIQPDRPIEGVIAPSQLSTPFQPPSLDNRAVLCPDCQHYLVRGRVQLKDATFLLSAVPTAKATGAIAVNGRFFSNSNLTNTSTTFLWMPGKPASKPWNSQRANNKP